MIEMTTANNPMDDDDDNNNAATLGPRVCSYPHPLAANSGANDEAINCYGNEDASRFGCCQSTGMTTKLVNNM